MSLTPLLFVHAFPFDGRMWGPQVEAFSSADRVVLAPNLRGFGTHPLGPPVTSIQEHAQDLIKLLDEKAIPCAVVVGLSMGGYVALSMARLAPQRIAGLVLADTKAEPDSSQSKEARTRRIERIGNEGLNFLPDETLPQLISPSCDETIKLEMRRWILEQNPAGVQSALQALRDRPDASDVLKMLSVPTCFICGEHDALASPEAMRQMARQVPGSELVLLPRAGHLSNLEAPQEFNFALSKLLERVEAAAGARSGHKPPL